MGDRLYEYCFVDIGARRRRSLFALFLGLTVAGVAAVPLHAPRAVVQWAGLLVALIADIGMTVEYCYSQPARTTVRESEPDAISRGDLIRWAFPLSEKLSGAFTTVALIAAALFSPSHLAARVTERKIRDLSQGDIDKEEAQRLIDLLNKAERRDIRTNPAVLAEIGPKLFAAAEHSPYLSMDPSWEALKRVLSYRTFLNAAFVPHPERLHRHLDYSAVVRGLIVATPDVAPKFSGCIIEGITVILGPDPAKGEENQVPVMRDVVFRNCLIAYRDGPARLEDITFINCRFQIPQLPRGLEFARALLNSTTINLLLEVPARKSA